MTFRPLHEFVLVRRLEPEERTKGGIVLPDQAKAKPQRGTVLAVGPGKLIERGERIGERVEMSVEVGQTVLFGAYRGQDVKGDNRKDDLMLIREDDIVAVVE